MSLPFRPSATLPSRKRTAFLTREEIVTAAALVLERDGYDALNMRSLAAELRVQAAALYRHVESRAELDDLLFDRLMADCAPRVRGAKWQDDLVSVANAWRQRLVSRRDATRIALSQITIGPNIAPLMEFALETLQRSGLDDIGIVDAFQALFAFVHGFASDEAGRRAHAPNPAARNAPMPAEWTEIYPTLSRLEPVLSGPPDDEAYFTFGLEALIAGIQRRLARRK